MRNFEVEGPELVSPGNTDADVTAAADVVDGVVVVLLCAGLPLDGTTVVGVVLAELVPGAVLTVLDGTVLVMLCAALSLDGTTVVGVVLAELAPGAVLAVLDGTVLVMLSAGLALDGTTVVGVEVGGTAVFVVAVVAELAPGAVLNGVAASWPTAFFSVSISARFCASKLAKQACVG